MKRAFLILILMAGSSATAGECLRCGAINSVLERMATVKPEPWNRDTLKTQEEILDRASDLIAELMNSKDPMTVETAKALLQLTAKALPYDQATLIVQDEFKQFRIHYARCSGNVFKPALDQLSSEGKITSKELAYMLKNFDVAGIRAHCAK